MAVGFIGGGNRRTRRKPPTCRKSLTLFITLYAREMQRFPNERNNAISLSEIKCLFHCVTSQLKNSLNFDKDIEIHLINTNKSVISM